MELVKQSFLEEENLGPVWRETESPCVGHWLCEGVRSPVGLCILGVLTVYVGRWPLTLSGNIPESL